MTKVIINDIGPNDPAFKQRDRAIGLVGEFFTYDRSPSGYVRGKFYPEKDTIIRRYHRNRYTGIMFDEVKVIRFAENILTVSW